MATITIEALVEAGNALTEKEFTDLEHFVNTNQIPVMSMSRFSKLGFCDDHGHPTEFAKAVVEEVNG